MTKQPTWMGTLAVLVVGCASPGAPVERELLATSNLGGTDGPVTTSIVGTKAIFSGSDNLYAVATAENSPGGLLWMGGWMTPADVAIGDDRLYQGYFDGNLVTGMAPLAFDNPGYAPGYVAGYHANDPSVVYLPSSGWYFMYYTLLNDAYGTDMTAMMRRNWVGFASSANGGATWTDHGVILGQTNGYDGGGAWAPSAVVVGDEIWLYYHTGAQNCADAACSGPGTDSPSVLRSRLSMNGWQLLATEPVRMPGGALLHEVNVDVTFAQGQFWMVANPTLAAISLHVSTDGLSFVASDGASGIIASGGASSLITPRIQVTSPTTFDVFFSLGVGSGGAQSSHLWSFASSASSAIH